LIDFRLFVFGVALFEPLDATGGIDHAFFTGVKGVAGAAQLNLERLAGGPGGKSVATGT